MTDKEKQLARALMQAYLGSDYESEPLSDADLMLCYRVKSALAEKGFSIFATDEINALKAQVNRLRYAIENRKTLTDIAINELIATTEKQCLAEVKTKAVEDATMRTNDGSRWFL